MATGSEVKVEEYFQCLICNQPVTKPKLLLCLHTFCEDCVQKEYHGRGVKCPICGMMTNEDLTTLKDNVFVANLQKKVKKQQQILASNELRCVSCEDSASPEFMCLECDKLLCTKCLHTHQVLMTDHKKYVQTLGTLRKLDSDEFLKILRRPKHLFCSTHDDQQLSLYCTTCSVWLCVLCLVLEHKDHNCCGIRKQIAAQKNEFREMLGTVEENERKFSKTQGDLELLIDKLNSGKYNMEELIRARVTAAIEKVKEEEDRLLNELKELHSARIQKLQEDLMRTENVLKRMSASKSLVAQLLRYATEQEVLELQGSIKSALTSLREEKPLNVQMANTVIDFQECWTYPEKMLGNLIITKLRPEAVPDGKIRLSGHKTPTLYVKEDMEHTSRKCCDKRKRDADTETQPPTKQCVKEEAGKSVEGTSSTSSNYWVHSPTPRIENVISCVEDDGKQTESFVPDTIEGIEDTSATKYVVKMFGKLVGEGGLHKTPQDGSGPQIAAPEAERRGSATGVELIQIDSENSN
ncbi:protein PML-like [Scyliorhinus canicula]|uniref:protein PML-like n=1 Tax=Scyliorhinus canicula TaxID=7830 RepID=UPI0018F723D2|nr:protein PML-like [Scyliorhinus canicula]